MPGPNSDPHAHTKYGTRINGKTAIVRAGLKSCNGDCDNYNSDGGE